MVASAARSARTNKRAGAVSSVSAKPGLAAPAAANSAAWAAAAASGRPVGQRVHRDQSGRAHGQVLVPAGEVEIAQGLPLFGILDHDDPPALPVAARRSETGRVEQACEHLVGHGVGVELARCSRGAQRGEQVERRHGVAHRSGHWYALVVPRAAIATAATERLRALSPIPLVSSPMAGGPSTVDLVVAVSAAGAFGFLAGGYKTAEALAEEMARVRAAGVGSFGVNLFVPGGPTADPDGLAPTSACSVRKPPRSGRHSATPPGTTTTTRASSTSCSGNHPRWSASPSACRRSDAVRALQAAGVARRADRDHPEEATAALRLGPDALCLQGSEAGAHRGSLANDFRPDADRPIHSLLASVWGRTLVPADRRRWRRRSRRRLATCWPAAPRSSRPEPRSCAVPRAGPNRWPKTRWPIPRSPPRR